MNAFTARFALWGNSLAVRIPSRLAKEARIVEGGRAELSVADGRLIVQPIDIVPVYNLTDLIQGITDENRHVEISTGHAQGAEFA